MRLASRFAKVRVPAGAVACAWLGQAGYLMKTSAGLSVMIDPYFSDEVEKLEGLKRVFPPPITADELQPEVLLVSHGHLDHFDEPTIKSFALAGRTLLVAPPSCIARARALGWATPRMRSLVPGKSATKSGLRITATFARHTLPDAIGFLLDIDGLRLWHSGDTEYDQHLRALAAAKLDVAFICHQRRWREHECTRGGATRVGAEASERGAHALRPVGGEGLSLRWCSTGRDA